jgi:hypothetical protein
MYQARNFKIVTRRNLFVRACTYTTVARFNIYESNMLRSIVSTLPRTAARVALRNAPVATKPLLPAYSSPIVRAIPAFGSNAAMRAYTSAVAPEIKRAAVQSM